MESIDSRAMEPAARVRRGYWGLLLAALVLALAVPLAVLCHASLAPLTARAYISPAAPQAGRAARLVVELSDAADRAATDGPWAEATVAWDMQRMTMGTRSLAITGSQRTPGIFSVPLVVTMAGTWYARIAVRTPGRPVWHGLVYFTVMPPGAASAQSVSIANRCALTVSLMDGSQGGLTT